MTDTASFKLPKTTARIHRITAELLDVGVSPMEIYDHVYNTLSLGTLQLIAQGIANLHTLEDGAIAYLFVTQAMLRETGVGLSDTERLLEYLLGLPTTKIAVMFIEMPDGTTKISFRSRGNLAVNKIAKIYGGGGHQNAAGCTAPFPLQQTISRVLPQCAQMLHTGDFTPTKT
jgi:bifunctional oligoribonuclease and PAP phosphatase NrnA